MTKTILLGMTAEEIVEKLKQATPQEAFEFHQLISSMGNYAEIKKEIDAVAVTHIKESMSELMDDIQKDMEEADEEEKMILGAFGNLVSGLAGLIDAVEEAEDKEKEEHDLTSILRAQMTTPKPTLADQLKAQLAPKKSLADILREQMEPKKTLSEVLKEQMEAKTTSVTKEDILDGIIEQILEIELESDEMVISQETDGYTLAIGLMFAVGCARHDVRYELEEKDIEMVLTEVISGLIEDGREVSVRFEEGNVITVIR